MLDGGFFGSGEHMVKKLKECADKAGPGAQVDVLARFDEMAEPFEKAKATGSTLELQIIAVIPTKLNHRRQFQEWRIRRAKIHFQLRLETSPETASRKHLPVEALVDRDCLVAGTYAYADRTPHRGDWSKIDQIAVTKTLAKIGKRMNKLQEPAQADDSNPFDPAEPLIRLPIHSGRDGCGQENALGVPPETQRGRRPALHTRAGCAFQERPLDAASSFPMSRVLTNSGPKKQSHGPCIGLRFAGHFGPKMPAVLLSRWSSAP